jgi:hypothetical protein
MRRVWRRACGITVLAASLASAAPPQPTPEEVRPFEVEAINPRCYAEYWYEEDPSRRVRVYGQLAAPQGDVGSADASKKSCRSPYFCACDDNHGGPLPVDDELGESEELAPDKGPGTASAVRGGASCDLPCICKRKSRFFRPGSGGETSKSRSQLHLSVGPDAIVTLKPHASRGADAQALTLSGASERPLESGAFDLSALEVRCKPQPSRKQ